MKKKIIRTLKSLLIYTKEKVIIFYYFLFKNTFYKKIKIPSHLTLSEKRKLFSLSQKKTNIAEIGSYVGASACCFGAALKSNRPGKIICIDTWNNDSMSEGCRDTWNEFQTNTREYNNFIIPLRGFSTDVICKVKEITLTLDILFIDGDHSYNGVKADWDTYKNLLDKDSIVIFHDYGWAEGVKRVVHEDVMPFVSSYNQLPNMWWAKIGTKP